MAANRFSRLAFLVLLASIFAAGCDTFFTVDATVIACDSKVPLEGVAATLHLDQGVSEEDHHDVTDAAGKISMTMNEPDTVTATLSLTKAGFVDWSQHYRGAPKRPVDICLVPVGR